MISEADKVVEYTDTSLNSELETIKALSKEALRKGRSHNIILMVDLGDLREGYYNEKEIYEAVEHIIKMNGGKISRYRDKLNLLWRSNP